MMRLRFLFALSFVLASSSLACTASPDEPDAPVIDALDVPSETSTMSLQGISGPGIMLTVTAHDESAGLAALHVGFVAAGKEQTVNIPNAPKKLSGQQIELLIVGAPKGDLALEFYLSDTEGHRSAAISKTVTVQ